MNFRSCIPTNHDIIGKPLKGDRRWLLQKNLPRKNRLRNLLLKLPRQRNLQRKQKLLRPKSRLLKQKHLQKRSKSTDYFKYKRANASSSVFFFIFKEFAATLEVPYTVCRAPGPQIWRGLSSPQLTSRQHRQGVLRARHPARNEGGAGEDFPSGAARLRTRRSYLLIFGQLVLAAEMKPGTSPSHFFCTELL